MVYPDGNNDSGNNDTYEAAYRIQPPVQLQPDPVMALQELAPLPRVTGYTALGNAIANAADVNRERQQQLADAALRRSQALEDIGSARQFEMSEADRQNAQRINTEKQLGDYRANQAAVQALVNEGYLDGSQRDDKAAIAAAYQRAHADGVDKLYLNLLNTLDPDTNQPLLRRDDVGNPALVQAAKDKLSVIQGKQLAFTMGQPENAQATINDFNRELLMNRQQQEAVRQRANHPLTQYGPTDAPVLTLAAQMAEQFKKGSGKDFAAVAAQVPAALRQLNDQNLLAWNQNTQSAKIELQSLRDSESQLTNAMTRAMQTFKVAPGRAPVGPAAPPSVLDVGATVGPRIDPAGAMQDFVSQVTRGGVSAAPGTAATPQPETNPILANPTANPTIEAGNAYLAAQKKVALQDELNAVVNRGKVIEQNLARSSNTGGVGIQMSPELGPGYATALYGTPPDPYQAAKTVSDLLRQKAENDAKIKALQAQLQGSGPASMSAPAISTPTAFTPAPAFAAPTLDFPTTGKWWNSQPALAM